METVIVTVIGHPMFVEIRFGAVLISKKPLNS